MECTNSGEIVCQVLFYTRLENDHITSSGRGGGGANSKERERERETEGDGEQVINTIKPSGPIPHLHVYAF